MTKTSLAMFCLSLMGSLCQQAQAADILAALQEGDGETKAIDAKAWNKYMGGFTLSQKGDEIIAVRSAKSPVRSGANWRYLPAPNQKSAAITITAEGLAETYANGKAILYLDVYYEDGSALWGQKAYFPTTSNVWNKVAVSVLPTRPLKQIWAYLMIDGGEGIFRFRRPAITIQGADCSRFDSVAVRRGGALPVEPCCILRDAKEGGFALVKTGQCAKGVKVDVKSTAMGKTANRHDVTLTLASTEDRCLTFVYAIPLCSGEITWFPDFDKSEVLSEKDASRISGESVNCGVGVLSRSPVGAVKSAKEGIALGLDPEAPAVFRTGIGLNRSYIAFDVAVTREKPTARFAFVDFRFDANEGFRGAWSAYMKMFPEAFRVRAPRHGVWMPFRKISTVPKHEDFGFAFKEGIGENDWDDAHGYYTFRYTEPTTWWMPIAGKDGRKSATWEECLKKANELAAKGHELARGWQKSSIKDEAGAPYGRILDTPWCNGAVWIMNAAPNIPGGEFQTKNGEPQFSARYKDAFPKGLDGEYVDSAELYLTPDLDFDREHFSFVETPLSWSRHSLKPGVYKGLIGFEYVRALAKKIHGKGRLMMANGVPTHWCWQIPFIDVTGTETDWNRRGEWKPTSVADLLYRRALCGGKPYCFLMNTDFSLFDIEKTKKFFERSLAFGMFPGFFSPVASSRKGSHYFDHPEWYEPARPLFLKYVPLSRKISEAGWRPINRLVVCSDKTMVCEQFGEKYVTVFNPTAKPLAVKFSANGSAKELLMDEIWAFASSPLEKTIPAESVRVLEFDCK